MQGVKSMFIVCILGQLYPGEKETSLKKYFLVLSTSIHLVSK